MTLQRRLKLDGIGKDTHKPANKSPNTPYRLGQGITIGTDWKLTADRFNVIVWKKEGKDKNRWRAEGYFSTLGSALVFLVRQSVRDTELKSIQAVQEKIEQVERDILKMAVGR
jgi:hypothetical protein